MVGYPICNSLTPLKLLECYQCMSCHTLLVKLRPNAVVHAEANALLNTNRSDVRGSSIYVTMIPCNECAKLLIQAGIQEVIFMEV